MLNCYCQLSSSVIFGQYGVSQSEFKIDRPRPGLPRVSPRPHTEALGTRLCIIKKIDYRVEGSSRPNIIWVLFQEQHIRNDYRREYSYLYNPSIEKCGFQFLM